MMIRLNARFHLFSVIFYLAAPRRPLGMPRTSRRYIVLGGLLRHPGTRGVLLSRFMLPSSTSVEKVGLVHAWRV